MLESCFDDGLYVASGAGAAVVDALVVVTFYIAFWPELETLHRALVAHDE